MKYFLFNKILLCGDIEENPGPLTVIRPITTQNIEWGNLSGLSKKALVVKTDETGVEFASSLPNTTANDPQKVVFVKSDLTYGIGTIRNYSFNNLFTGYTNGGSFNSSTLGDLTGTVNSNGEGMTLWNTDPSYYLSTNNTTVKKFFTVKIVSLGSNSALSNYGIGLGVANSSRNNTTSAQNATNAILVQPNSLNLASTTHNFKFFQGGFSSNNYVVTLPNNDWCVSAGSSFYNPSRWVGCFLSFGIDNTVSPKKVHYWIHNTSGTLIQNISDDLNTNFNNVSQLMALFTINAWSEANRNFSLHINNGGENIFAITGWSYLYPQFIIS